MVSNTDEHFKLCSTFYVVIKNRNTKKIRNKPFAQSNKDFKDYFNLLSVTDIKLIILINLNLI